MSPEMNPQNAANSLWSCATLGVSDPGVLRPILDAALRMSPEMNPQGVANSLWSCVAMSLSDSSVLQRNTLQPLLEAVKREAPNMNEEGVNQCLQASAAGIALDKATLDVCKRKLRPQAADPTTSQLQMRAGSALKRLGFPVEYERPILEGLQMVDIVITLANGDCVAFEADGPRHFMQSPLSSSESRTLGPRTTATILRDHILKQPAAGFKGKLGIVTFRELDACRSESEEDAVLTKELARLGISPPGAAS
jgi:hypothetical protein